MAITKLVAITGPPCAGKTTHARAMATGPGHVLLSTGKIAREMGNPVDQMHTAKLLGIGCMYPDNNAIDKALLLRLRAFADEALADYIVIVDGWPRFGSQVDTMAEFTVDRAIEPLLLILTTDATLARSRAELAGKRAGHDARAALWYGHQLHEVMSRIEHHRIPWVPFDGRESIR